MVEKHKLTPNVDYNKSLIHLPRDYHELSTGGNDIVIEDAGNNKFYILFFTYRGILDNYSGFLYVPDNGNIEDYEKRYNGEKFQEIEQYDKNWYFVANN